MKQEERILLSISVDNESTRVKIDTRSPNDIYNLCIALAQVIKQNEMIDAGLGLIMHGMNTDPAFLKEIEDSTIDTQVVNQFNDILNQKH